MQVGRPNPAAPALAGSPQADAASPGAAEPAPVTQVATGPAPADGRGRGPVEVVRAVAPPALLPFPSTAAALVDAHGPGGGPHARRSAPVGAVGAEVVPTAPGAVACLGPGEAPPVPAAPLAAAAADVGASPVLVARPAAADLGDGLLPAPVVLAAVPEVVAAEAREDDADSRSGVMASFPYGTGGGWSGSG